MGGARSAKRLPEKEIIASEVAGGIFENKGEDCENWNEKEFAETKPLNANSQVKQWSKWWCWCVISVLLSP